ncbi:MAG TPA: PAS domain-containing protein, partial [Nitrospiria bacterium]|nr:PAS domain-containing protein [Nitrospiria bacterium]
HSPSVFMSGEVSYGRDLIHPDDQEQVWDNVQAALRKKQAFELTYRIRTSNQTEKWVWEQGHGVFSDEGELIALEGFITDISEKRRAEELLTESQERLKAQYRGFPVPTSSWKRVMGGRFILVDYNEAMEETLGHTIKELLGREAGELYGSRPDILENFEACLSSRETIRREVEFRYPSGESARNLSMTFVFVPPDLVMVHAEDITERKWAETELNRSNNVFKLLAGYNEQISGLGVEAAARKTLELIREQLGYPDCSVALWESGRGGFRTLRGPGGEGGGGREEAFIPSEKTVLSEMVGTPDPRYRPDIEAENPSTAMDQLLLSAGIRSDFIVPLWGGHRFLGTLNVGSGRVNGFSSTDRYHLTLIGPRLSQAIHNASLIKKLEKSQESLSEAQRVARIGNWDWNIKSNELKWSDEIYRIFGLDPQTFGATYEAFLEAVHP